MANGKATEEVAARAARIKAAQRAIFREAAQRAVEVMQTPGPSVANPSGGRGGNLPIDSGFLQASLEAAIGGATPPQREKPPGEHTYRYDPGEVNSIIESAAPGDVVTVAYAANYARFANYRYQFVGLTAQRWPAIVREVQKEVKARTGL